jgi:hypothetical protein
MSTTTTPTTDRTVEYGALTGVTTRWMDRDGDLPLGRSEYVWGAKHKSEAELLAAIARVNPAAKLVKRYRSVVVTDAEVVKPPLPTAKGSVVRATVQVRGEAVERLFFSYGSGDTWVADRPTNGSFGNVFAPAELTVVDVLLDASTL